MKKLKTIIIFLLLILTTGCGDYRELTDMSIVSSVGLDKVDEMYELTVQILDSKMQNGGESSGSSGGSSPKIVVYSSTGKTIHESFRNVVLQAPKKLYIGHIETVIISEKAAKENISSFFDFFLRDAEASKDFNILLAKDYSIKEIMDVLTPLETIPAENIASSIETSSTVEGAVLNVPFDKFVSNTLQTGVDAVMPVLTIINVEGENEEINPSKRLKLTKQMAIFDDYKLLKYTDEYTSLGYNLLKEQLSSNVISFKCDDKNSASIELVSNKSDFSFDTKKNTIKIESKIKGLLSELNCNLNLEKEEDIKKLEDKLKKNFESIFKSMIDTAKDNPKSDFIGIGSYIFKNENKFYKKNKGKIEDMIKNMKSDIKIDVDFIQKGSIKEGDEKY